MPRSLLTSAAAAACALVVAAVAARAHDDSAAVYGLYGEAAIRMTANPLRLDTAATAVDDFRVTCAACWRNAPADADRQNTANDTPPQAVAVPEPPTYALAMVAGVLGAGAAARKKFRQSK